MNNLYVVSYEITGRPISYDIVCPIETIGDIIKTKLLASNWPDEPDRPEYRMFSQSVWKSKAKLVKTPTLFRSAEFQIPEFQKLVAKPAVDRKINCVFLF